MIEEESWILLRVNRSERRKGLVLTMGWFSRISSCGFRGFVVSRF